LNSWFLTTREREFRAKIARRPCVIQSVVGLNMENRRKLSALIAKLNPKTLPGRVATASLAVLSVSLSSVIGGPALALTVTPPPLATFTVSLTTPDNNYFMTGNTEILNANVTGCINLNCGSASGTASKTLNALGNNAASIGGSAQPNPDGSGAEATIDYYFEAVGATNTSVIFDIEAAGSASETGSGTAFAHLYLNGSSTIGSPPILASACSSFQVNGCGSISSAFFLNSVFGAQSNTVQEIEIDVDGSANPNGGTYGASVDPTIIIDPAFLAANPGFTLEFSSNVTQDSISETPIPAALPLFASGMFALGLLGRRKNRHPLGKNATPVLEVRSLEAQGT
jgi:hypothetical protein